jgi:hypothetical protein
VVDLDEDSRRRAEGDACLYGPVNAVAAAVGATNICCESSARDAYEVTMVSDSLFGQSFGLHEASLATIFPGVR